VRQVLPRVSLYDLVAAYGRISARTRPALHVVRARQVVTLEDALARVGAMIGDTTEWRQLEAFLPPAASAEPRLRRSALASSFLAALELARQGRATLRQDAPFAPLLVRGGG
jgi:segregation and condensation protein A